MSSSRIKVFILVLTILLRSSNAISQTMVSENDSVRTREYYKSYKWHVGVFGGASLNLHMVDFRELPGIPGCCPQYSTGFGIKSSFGALFDYSLEESNNWYLEFRLSYSDLGAVLKAEEWELMYDDPNSSVEGLIEHTIETVIDFLSIEPIIRVNILEKMSWHIGASAGVIINSGFDQKETLIEPADLLFENNQRTRLTYDGEINNLKKFQFGICMGLSYDLPLSRDGSWVAAPEIFVTFRPGNIIESKTWNISSLRIGLAIKYESERRVKYTEYIPIPVPEKDTIPVVDTLIAQEIVPVKKEPVIKNLSVELLDFDGNPIEDPTIKVRNIVSSKQYPLVNFIFFDSLSSEIPDKYRKLSKDEVNNFDLDLLEGLETIQLNREILNIIGKRLQLHPEINLRITGCNSNDGEEKNNIRLSKSRAESVKDYLVSIWGIEADRLSTHARNLPSVPSNPESHLGREENRRVEISSSDHKMFYPLFFDDTTRAMSASTVRFKVDLESDNEIKNWKINIMQGDNVLKQETGDDVFSEITDIEIDNRFLNNTRTSEEITYSFQVVDSDGLKSNIDSVRTAVDQRFEQESTIEVFSLLLFGFDRFNLSPEHIPLLDYIRTRVKPNSKVRIIGYADDSGDLEHNLELSERRAREAARRLNVNYEEVKGVGNVVFLYKNKTPLGRFLSRTVQIIIETPKENNHKKD